ncbi:hypothetical protein BGZ47_008270 [Haplosporangium gracile]|nr:hypothetical protein BGZ47_008270 [Haplosporangium gracile]
MTENPLSLFCLVNGEATSNAFSVKILSCDTVDDLKNHIKTALTPQFDDIAARDLTLYRVSHPVISANRHSPILLSAIDSPTELDPTDDVSERFPSRDKILKKTIHIIVQRPSPVIKPHNEKRPSLGFRNAVICWTLARFHELRSQDGARANPSIFTAKVQG